jgi:hypothetical protein
VKCGFAPEGVTCDTCRFGRKNAPTGHYTNGCDILETYVEAQMDLKEGRGDR